jgi:arabinoxylan arabinofuranohydrolase
MENESFIMEDWWIWSSTDLVNWELESVLDPADTYIGAGFQSAWATDAAYRNGKYYWYFSELNEQTGVVVGDSPVGPWKDPLGKPFLAEDLTPTHEYDISVIEYQGIHYAIFGVWDYYIARMGDDMISLAETPRKIIINDPVGPYGEDSTDDKPSVHERNGVFYLSWGAFYATSENIYGPYDYKGVIVNEGSFAPGYDAPTWPHGFQQGRHGNFFKWHKQWYFAYCDISQTGNRYFRDTFISYVHYKDNGEIAPIRVDGIGVGEYDASQGKIEAEDYFTEIDRRGGVLKCIEEGFFQRELARSAYQHQREIETKERVVVGVNDFTLDDEKIDIPVLKIDREAEANQIAFCKKIKAGRDNDAAQAGLAKLRLAANTDGNTFEALLDCARAYVSVGEMCDVLREEWGVYVENQAAMQVS